MFRFRVSGSELIRKMNFRSFDFEFSFFLSNNKFEILWYFNMDWKANLLIPPFGKDDIEN